MTIHISTPILKDLVAAADEQPDGYFEIVKAIALLFPKNLVEQLEQLIKGPVWDGDVISKADRETLFEIGLAIRVCAKGTQGYTGATYTAWSILREIKENAKP